MPRKVSEWIAKHDDQAVPPRVRRRIWERQCGEANFVVCPLSGAILRHTGECELDHETALIDNGAHRESNLRYVAIAAHKAKTASEVAVKKHVNDRANSHLRIKSGNGNGFRTRDHATRKADAEARARDRRGGKTDQLPPRQLYADV